MSDLEKFTYFRNNASRCRNQILVVSIHQSLQSARGNRIPVASIHQSPQSARMSPTLVASIHQSPQSSRIDRNLRSSNSRMIRKIAMTMWFLLEL
jgi:hypothetical protein